MPTLLHIDASPAGPESVSRSVAQIVRSEWDGDVVYRDLAVDPVSHLSAAEVIARRSGPGQLSAELKKAVASREELINELLAADAYLFAVPLYNYSVPSVFKAWIDKVIVPGRTAALGNGRAPTAGRRAVVVSARGGGYGPESPNHGKDLAIPWLQLILGDDHALGLDLRFITPELTMAPIVPAMAQLIPMHEESLRRAREQAYTEARSLVSQLTAADHAKS